MFLVTMCNSLLTISCHFLGLPPERQICMISSPFFLFFFLWLLSLLLLLFYFCQSICGVLLGTFRSNLLLVWLAKRANLACLTNYMNVSVSLIVPLNLVLKFYIKEQNKLLNNHDEKSNLI